MKERYYYSRYMGINVDKFKQAVENAIRNTIVTTHQYKVYQRCYQDGRWEITLYTLYERIGEGYRKKWKFHWDDMDTDIEEFIGIITADFFKWIIEQEQKK